MGANRGIPSSVIVDWPQAIAPAPELLAETLTKCWPLANGGFQRLTRLPNAQTDRGCQSGLTRLVRYCLATTEVVNKDRVGSATRPFRECTTTAPEIHATAQVVHPDCSGGTTPLMKASLVRFENHDQPSGRFSATIEGLGVEGMRGSASRSALRS
jgi:hypothetical protein